MSAYLFWLSVGVLCLGAEALGISGIGLLFAGFGAISAGAALYFVPELSELLQLLVFLVATALWAAILWKPLQKFRAPKNKIYQNIIGDTAYISSEGLKKGEVGEATWSGTIMRAQLSDNANVESLAGGSQTIITALSGNILILKPKN